MHQPLPELLRDLSLMTGSMGLLILNGFDVASLLRMPKCIELMESALTSLARGDVMHPLRTVLRIPESRNVFALMPAYSRSLEAMSAKLITVFPDNHGTGLDSHQGAVLLFDGGNGSLRAVMDAASITAIRTAAVSGLATRLLARQDAAVLGILGSGVQARTHLEAMLAVRRFQRVLVWSRDAEHARAFAEATSARHSLSVTTADAETATRNADVICTVTAAREPVLRGEWLRPGTHVNAVGASLPAARELDSVAVSRARVFVDRRESAMNEAGDLIIPMHEGSITRDHIAGEIGDILTGSVKGRTHPDEITLFKSLGLAIEDLASAHFLYEAATRARAGSWVDFGGASGIA